MTRVPCGIAVLWLALGSLGCATVLDLEGARRFFEREPVPTLPLLIEDEATDLATVSGLRATAGELRAVPLVWEPLLAGAVAGYVVERAIDSQSPFERIAQVPGRFGTAYVDRGSDLAAKHQTPVSSTGLGDGHTYLYRVRAFEPSGRQAPEPPTFVEAETAPAPNPPAGFEAYSQLPRRVALRWDPAEDATVSGYRVYRSPSARGDYRPVADLEGRFRSTWIDQGLGDLRVFYYRVAAVNAAGGEGEPTAPERAVTKPDPLPPANVSLVGQELGRNRLGWVANVEPDLVAYRLLRRREGAALDEIVGTFGPDALEAVDEAVGAGEVVSYSLVAVDRDGLESRRSDPIGVKSVAYDLEVELRGDDVLLGWDADLHREIAEIRIVQVGTFGSQELARVPSEGWIHDGEISGRTLRYQLVGVRADGTEAPPSAVVSIEVPD